MKYTPITSPSGTQAFNYIVDGTDEGRTSADYTSSILMYAGESTIEYGSGQKLAANTNIDVTTGDPKTLTVVKGNLLIVLQNTVDDDSLPVYLTFTDPVDGDFTIESVYGSPYTASPVLIGVIPATSDPVTSGRVEVEVVVVYKGNDKTATETITAGGYEYDSVGPIEYSFGTEDLIVNVVFALLSATVSLVNADNSEYTGSTNFNVGQEVYFLSTINNIGDQATIGTTTPTTFTQTFPDYLTLNQVKFGYSKTTPMTNTGSVSGKTATASITDSIPVGTAQYYVQVKATVKATA